MIRTAGADPPGAVYAPREEQEQINLVRWLDFLNDHCRLDIPYHAIPNGGLRNKRTGAKLKRLGTKAGVPDLFFCSPQQGYPGLYIEMKRLRGGRLSPEQKRWIDRLTKQGYKVATCEGAQAAKKTIMDYFGFKSPLD
jgi:hypothetical protein